MNVAAPDITTLISEMLFEVIEQQAIKQTQHETTDSRHAFTGKLQNIDALHVRTGEDHDKRKSGVSAAAPKVQADWGYSSLRLPDTQDERPVKVRPAFDPDDVIEELGCENNEDDNDAE